MATSTLLKAQKSFTDADAALAHAFTIYAANAYLRDSLQRFVAGESLGQHVACYPYVQVQTETVTGRADSPACPTALCAGPGAPFETTLTRPDLFANYYPDSSASC